MGLLDNIKQSSDDYICFVEFITKLSESEQETIADLGFYLLQIKLHERINYYYIDEPYTYHKYTQDNLEWHLIQSKRCNYIFTEKEISLNLETAQITYHRHKPQPFLKKSELLAIDELSGHLDFLAGETTDARLPNTASQQAQLQAKDDEIARLNQIITELQKQLTITQNAGVNDELQTELATAQQTITNLQTELATAQDKIKELESKQSNELLNNELKTVHTNTAITAFNNVLSTHWQNPSEQPKQEFIISWIVENYPTISKSKALWIDKIIRHEDN